MAVIAERLWWRKMQLRFFVSERQILQKYSAEDACSPLLFFCLFFNENNRQRLVDVLVVSNR